MTIATPTRPAGRAGARPTGPAGTRPSSNTGKGTATAQTAPDARLVSLAHAVARLWVEVESGRRSPRSVAHLLDHRLYRRLQHRWITGAPPARVRRVHVQAATANQVDVVAVVEREARVGAVALRLRRRHDGWCVEEADRPEDRTRHVPAGARVAAAH